MFQPNNTFMTIDEHKQNLFSMVSNLLVLQKPMRT